MDSFQLDRQFQISHSEDGYYHEYCRLYLANVALTSQVRDLIDEKQHLHSRLSKYEDDDFCSSYDRNFERNKRFRRTAHEIERYYKCQVRSCEKSYGSQGSLNQHYKLKHPQIYVTLPNVISTQLPQQQNLKEDEKYQQSEHQQKTKVSSTKKRRNKEN